MLLLWLYPIASG